MWINLYWNVFLIFMLIHSANTNDVLELLSKPHFAVTVGGTGLTVICFILLAVVLCFLSSLKKRLVVLETRLTTQQPPPQPLKAQSSTQSNTSNYAYDVESIPKVPRRSEYIRQKVVNEIQNWRKRVSRTLPFINTPRSSADTFDLGKHDDPIYDDIANCRPVADDNSFQKRCCWCLCCRSSEYKKARTSDPKTVNDDHKKTSEKSDENEQPVIIEKVNEVGTYQDKKDIIKNKKRQKGAEQIQDIEVKHVEFDEREIRIQPKTTDDVAIIGLSPKAIKQVNKEQHLVSFGKTATMPNKHEYMNKPTTPTVANDTTTKIGRIPLRGVKIIDPCFPIPPEECLSTVTEEQPEETSDQTFEEKERDPSYIDMSQTRKDSPS